jgi:hypothetical protein
VDEYDINRPLVRRRGKGKEQKPCPTCYQPMRETKTGWACAKHGAPSKP